ncbi:lysophospholipid acyltransferase family protein [Brevibacterium yomogidense]|uniref:lysophospholipid acyltransferase family protein n=1 Tax=Brevibacterium yomogidense TaxID=946573 RepID=UPI0038CC000F
MVLSNHERAAVHRTEAGRQLFYWFLKRIVVGPILRVLFRPWTRGLEHLPVKDGAIIAANHLSFIDSIFVPIAVPRPVVYLAKNDYFTRPGVRGSAQRWFLRVTNQLPMDRGGGAGSEDSLRSGLEVLRAGALLGIYPEGTRSPDGKLHRGRTGVARLAIAAGVPVVPAALIGTDAVQPKGRTVPRIRRVGVVFGEPLDFARYEGRSGDRHVLRSVTDEIMYEIMRLSGQEYVDTYAASHKPKLLTADPPDPADPSAPGMPDQPGSDA